MKNIFTPGTQVRQFVENVYLMVFLTLCVIGWIL